MSEPVQAPILPHAAARIDLASKALRAASDELFFIGVAGVGEIVSEASERVEKLAEGLRIIAQDAAAVPAASSTSTTNTRC